MNDTTSMTLWCSRAGCSLTPSSSILLFLDFDGVLHPAGTGAEHFVNLPRLEKVLRECPAVRVVISSTWQEAYSLQALKRRFSDDIAARVIGVTRSADPNGEAESRYEEIRILLRRVSHFGAWIALDDTAEEFPDGCAQLILCDSARGLDNEAELRLRQALGARRSA